DRLAAGAKLTGHGAAELEEVVGLNVGELTGPHHDQPAGLDAVRRQKIERGAALALELVAGRGPLDHPDCRPQRFRSNGPELQAVVAEHHQNTARCAGKWDEADL